MNNAAISTKNDITGGTLSIELDGQTLTYSHRTDKRIVDAIDGKVFTRSKREAVELAGEIRAWGVTEARALGYAVVFWS
jgi:hypothetical protein